MAFEIAHQHLSTLMGVASREIDSIYRMQAALKAELEMTMAKNEKSKEPLAVPYPDLYKILMKEPTAPGKEAALKQLDAKFGKKKKAPKEKDPNAPKKPVTAYFSYVQDPQVKSQIDKEFPEMKSGEKQQIATQRWNAMSEEEQKVSVAPFNKFLTPISNHRDVNTGNSHGRISTKPRESSIRQLRRNIWQNKARTLTK